MTSKKSGKKTRRTGLRVAAIAAVMVAGGVFVYGRGPGGWFGEEATNLIEGAPVRRGSLSITVTERGNLEARDAISLRSEVEGRTTVLSLIPEGTWVEPGQILAELDTSELVDQKVQQEDEVLNSRANFTKATAELDIQKTENESLIESAKLQIEFAEIDLSKFNDADRKQQQQLAEEEIILAEQELANAKDQFNWSKELLEGGFLTRTEYDSDELSFKRAEIMLEQAKRAQSLLIEYEQKKEEKRLQGELDNARRELKKVELQAKAQLVDQETAVQTSEARLKLEEMELAKLNDQIAKATLRAPVAGMVVYGREEGGRWGGGEPVQEGGEIRERQEVISIPRSGGMIAKASIHESVLKQVEVGQEVIVRIDAIPSREFRGRVDFLAMLPDQNSWWANPNLRLYQTEISIADEDAQMRPGMSCNVEILVDDIEDTLYVPVQAVVHHAGKNLSFVANGGEAAERQVEIGAHNSKWVAIEKGLEEGEIVLLAPPDSFLRAATEESLEDGERRFPEGLVPGQGPGAAADASTDSEESERSAGLELGAEGFSRGDGTEGREGGERRRGDGEGREDERPEGDRREGERGGEFGERGGERGRERGNRPEGARPGDGPSGEAQGAEGSSAPPAGSSDSQGDAKTGAQEASSGSGAASGS